MFDYNQFLSKEEETAHFNGDKLRFTFLFPSRNNAAHNLICNECTLQTCIKIQACAETHTSVPS